MKGNQSLCKELKVFIVFPRPFGRWDFEQKPWTTALRVHGTSRPTKLDLSSRFAL